MHNANSIQFYLFRCKYSSGINDCFQMKNFNWKPHNFQFCYFNKNNWYHSIDNKFKWVAKTITQFTK